MGIRIGDSVIYTPNPEWGVGKVLRADGRSTSLGSGEIWYYVRFPIMPDGFKPCVTSYPDYALEVQDIFITNRNSIKPVCLERLDETHDIFIVSSEYVGTIVCHH